MIAYKYSVGEIVRWEWDSQIGRYERLVRIESLIRVKERGPSYVVSSLDNPLWGSFAVEQDELAPVDRALMERILAAQ